MQMNLLLRSYQTGFSAPQTQALNTGSLLQNATSSPQRGSQNLNSLLNQLSTLLSQAQAGQPDPLTQPLAQTEATAPDETIQALSAEQLKQLGKAALSDPQLPTAVKDLLRQYLSLIQDLQQLEMSAEEIRAGRVQPNINYNLEQLAQARERLQLLVDGVVRSLNKMWVESLNLRWRLTYRDEIETKRHFRERQRDDGLSARSLPQGLDATTAYAALEQLGPRPDLEHSSEILKQLGHRSGQNEASTSSKDAIAPSPLIR